MRILKKYEMIQLENQFIKTLELNTFFTLVENDFVRQIRESKQKLYYVSRRGYIYSRDKKTGVIVLVKSFYRDGAERYLVCNIINRIYYVHRLVAEAFINDFKEYHIINHINMNTTDNYYFNENDCNLELCTRHENNEHARFHKYLSQVADKVNNYYSIDDIKQMKLEFNTSDLKELAQHQRMKEAGLHQLSIFNFDDNVESVTVKFKENVKTE